MKNLRRFLLLGLAAVAAGALFAATMTAPPPWAFPVNPPSGTPAKDDGSLKHVPGSLAIIRRCRKSWPMDESRNFALAAIAIFRTGLAGLKTPALPDFHAITFCGRSRISEAAHGRARSRE